MSKQRTATDEPSRDRFAGGVSRRSFLKVGAAAGTVALAGCTGLGDSGGDGNGGPGSILAFHAGSLAPPFSAAESKFEEQTGIDVTREAKGSVASTKKITKQGRKADVLGVSDFRLIRNRVLPEFGSWYAILATNAMSIQYREDSTGADDISKDNWWDVLSRDDVTIGHSDPAVDPGGYRAVMTQQLGAIPFDGERLYDQSTYQQMRDNSIVPTGTETNLKGQLKSGKLDYAIYYQSISSAADLPYIDIQPQVDLSKATSQYAKHYSKATVETDSGSFTGAPIAYGITVPSVAQNPDGGARWVESAIADGGEVQQALTEKGLQPVNPAVVPDSGESEVPSNVMTHATAKSKLGPLTL